MLDELLGLSREAGDLTYRLFQTTLERVGREDDLLARVMPLCALPPAFDATIIGVLRDAPDDVEQNLDLLRRITGYSFVQAFEDSTFAYHETVREPLRTQLQAEHPEETLAIYQRLSMFYLERGKDIYHNVRRGDNDGFDRAMIEFNRGLAIAPDNHSKAEYHHWRGRVYMRLGRYDHAIKNFSQAIEYQPDNWSNYYRRATVQIEWQQYHEAVTDLDRAIALRDDVAKSFFARGAAYSKLQNYDQALADFDHALTLPPEKPDAHAEIYQARGILHWRQQQYDLAIENLTRAIEIDRDDGDHFFWRGVVYRAAQEPDKAIADFSAAIQKQDDLPINYRWRGTVYQEQQQFAQAAHDFTGAIEREPGNAANYYWRGMARYHMRDYDEALADFHAAIERDDTQCLYYIWRGTILYERGDDVAAQQDFDQAIALCPENPLAYEKRASSMYVNQPTLHDSALADLNTAIVLKPDYGQSYFWRAMVALDLGRYADAFSDIEHSIRYEPQRARGYFWRGVLYHLRGEPDAANADWEQAVRLADQSPRNLQDVRLALPLLMQGDIEGARACYTRALAMDGPAHVQFRYQLAGLRRLQRLYPQRKDIAEIANWLETQMHMFWSSTST
jgi:tetratricopeptide (TPR) repeat protein